MSYDLAVWHSEDAIGKAEAIRIYAGLCEEWPFLQGDSPNVEAFYQELTAKWPEIDSIAEEKVGDFDFCPWSCALNHSGMAVVISSVWSKAADVGTQVLQLAQKHELVLFDPQGPTVILPKSLQPKKTVSWFTRFFGGSK